MPSPDASHCQPRQQQRQQQRQQHLPALRRGGDSAAPAQETQRQSQRPTALRSRRRLSGSCGSSGSLRSWRRLSGNSSAALQQMQPCSLLQLLIPNICSCKASMMAHRYRLSASCQFQVQQTECNLRIWFLMLILYL